MKTKFILVLLILFGITTQVGFCQIDYNCFDTNEIYSEQPLSGELFAAATPPDIVTYFNKNWLSGDIWLTDGRIIRNKKIKYNGLLNELFWLELGLNQAIKLDKEAILQFHFLNFQGDTSVYFRKLKVKRDIFNDSIEIFGQELFHGYLSLYVLHYFYFDRREMVRVNKSYILKDIYKEMPVYYLRFLNSRVVEFKRFNRKNLYTFMPDRKNQIRKYFRDSISGNIKTKEEILSFIQFLSSIID
ncbi:MAG: hypothetical protein MUO72_01310 [Bacteroidales bacterium]|nr:hypothetical protein [Bacteroidales bacterium]